MATSASRVEDLDADNGTENGGVRMGARWTATSLTGAALCSFAANGEHQISLTVGDQLLIKEYSSGWYRGIVLRTGRSGIFPVQYVHLVSSEDRNNIEKYSTQRERDGVTIEITTVLREWHGLLKTYYRERKVLEFNTMKQRLTIMFDKYHKLMSPAIDLAKRESLKKEILKMIEQGRKYPLLHFIACVEVDRLRLLGLDIIVRTPTGEPADENNTPIISLYHMYTVASREVRNRMLGRPASNTPPLKRQRVLTMTNLTFTVSDTTESQYEENGLIAPPDGDEDTSPVLHFVHLFVELKIFMCSVGEETELFFSLYKCSEARSVTEEFVVELTSLGMPHDVSRIGKLATLFPNIPISELSDLCLLCRLIRRGKMQFDGMRFACVFFSPAAGKKTTRIYRRPFAAAVLSFANKKLQTGTHEITIPIYAAATESSLSTLPENILRSTGICEVPKAKGVCVGLQWYGGDLQSVQTTHPNLKGVFLTWRHSFPDVIDPGTVRNDLYVTLESGEFSQDRKTTSKNIEVIVQVRNDAGECIRNCIVMGSGVSPRDEFKSTVLYHTNSPRWTETFMVSLPIPLWDTAHLFITFRHCTTAESTDKSAFGFSFLRLINDDGTAITNKTHLLNSYKLSKNVVTNPYSVIDSFYLKEVDLFQNEAKNNTGVVPTARLILRKGECCKIRTLLSSTKLTQNYALLSLLHWNGEAIQMGDIIKRFTFVDVTDVVKFVPEIFNGLFNMLVTAAKQHTSNPPFIALQVYDAIVHTITLFVDDKKGQMSMRSVLDRYIKSYFQSQDAYRELLACTKHYLSATSGSNSSGFIGEISSGMANQSKLIATLKALEFVLKLIIRSRQIKTSSVSDPPSVHMGDSEFKLSVLEVFTSLNYLMRLKGKGAVGAQTMAIRNFASVLPDLEQICTPQEFSHVIANFISSIQYSDELRLLNTEKLYFVYNLVSSSRFYKNNNEVVRILNPAIMQTIKAHLGGLATRARKKVFDGADEGSGGPGKDGFNKSSVKADELTQCTFIMYIAIHTLQARMSEETLSLMELYSVLPELMQLILVKCNWTGEWRLNLVTIFVNIFHLMKPMQFCEFVRSLVPTQRCEFLLQVYECAAGMMHVPLSVQYQHHDLMFPENWFSLSMSQHSIVLKIAIEAHLPLLSGHKLLERNQPEQTKCLWQSAVQMQVNFLSARALQLEHFAKSKQQLIMERYSDLRLKMIEWLQKTWTGLQSSGLSLTIFMEEVQQTGYDNTQLVGSLLELMLNDKEQVREVGLELYYSLLEWEFNHTGSFTVVETQTINTIDRITSQDDQHKVDTIFKPFFTRRLAARFHEEDGSINQQGMVFLNDITQLLSLLLALRTLPKGEAYEDDRTIATMKLMAYLKQTDRNDTYIKYVHQLCQQHLQSHNYTEAGLTLLLHAELLSWSTTEQLPALVDPSFPAGTHAQRKELLYIQIIEHLDKAREWERAVSLIAALKALYEDVTFEYGKLSDILLRESRLFRNIVTVDRFFCEYFRVGYYGRGFDAQIQGKEFIYRGFELERVADFIQRILMKFPNAILLNYTELPPPEVLNGEGQFLQIFSVKPSPPINFPGNQTPAVNTKVSSNTYITPSFMMPLSAQRYHQNNNINTFVYSKPVRKAQDKNNEHKYLWVNMHYYFTEDTFPTIHRRSEVVRHHEVELSPVDNALAVMNSKNSELREMIERYQKNGEANISPFTMVLKGIISADVSGGAKLYKDAFFSSEFLVQHPEKAEIVQLLRLSIKTQLDLLERGLTLHKQLCTADISALQQTLEQQLDEMKSVSFQV